MQPTHMSMMSVANNYIDKFNVFVLVGHVEADKLHPSTVYWCIDLGQTYILYILKSHNKQEQNQDNIVGRQAYRLIINDVHKYIFNGSKLSKAWSYIHIFREKSIKVLVNALNLFIVLCLYREHDCNF